VNSTIYIGIDDTDNLESVGTGHLARNLGAELEAAGLVGIHSITRHQLLVDPAIPYTSHNSAACIKGVVTGDESRIHDCCSDFLLKHAATGSDVGLCIIQEENIPEEVVRFGQRTKMEVIKQSEAYELSEKYQILLQGLTGEHTGVIGALAATGLRYHGNDGRVLWMDRLREIQGVFTIEKFKQFVPVDEIVDLEGIMLPSGTRLMITDWCRPVVRNKKIVLFAEKSEDNENYEYQSAPKEYIKHISE